VPYDYDLIVLGGGPAGEKGAAQAAYFKKRVALVEAAPAPGGACVHTGTLPSKTLREAALALSGHRDRDLYGIRIEVDALHATPRMLSRKDAVRGLEVERIRWNLDRHGVAYFQGFGAFVDAHTIAIAQPDGTTKTITGEFILIATGSEPFQPADIAFEDPDIDDSDTILQIDRLPSSLVVVGGGVIGCEYACMFGELGVNVTLVDGRDTLLPFLDREISERLAQSMKSAGIAVKLSASYTSIRRDGADREHDAHDARDAHDAHEAIVCVLSDGSELRCDKLLFAAGRGGRTRGLGLDRIGISTDKRGTITVGDHYRTNVENIYAVGDVIGFPALASTSMEQARVAVVNAFDLRYKEHVGALLPYGIYTIPEVSFVGATEEELVGKKTPYVAGRAHFRDMARGKIIGERDGMLKLLVRREDRKIAGVHVLGERAAELVHIGQAIMTLGGGVDALIEMVFNYPTLAEAYKYAAYEALGHLAAR
jgi:NAD(P) transhydrogenase